MRDIQLIVEQLITDIDSMTELLYQNKVLEGNEKLDGVINLMVSLVQKITEVKKQEEKDVLDENLIMINMGKALSAMEQKDHILLADIFHFDIKGLLSSLL